MDDIMKVGEFIETLKLYPPDATIYISNNRIAFDVGTSIDEKEEFLEICCGTNTVDVCNDDLHDKTYEH